MQGAVAGLVFLAVLVIFAIIVVAKSVALIPQAEAAVIERLGRYSRTVSGQLTLLVPFIDRVRARVDLRERVVSFPPQPVITEDNLTLNIDTVVSWDGIADATIDLLRRLAERLGYTLDWRAIRGAEPVATAILRRLVSFSTLGRGGSLWCVTVLCCQRHWRCRPSDTGQCRNPREIRSTR